MAKLKKPLDTYKLAEKVAQDYNRQREYQKNKAVINYEIQQARYKKSFSGRVGSRVSQGLSFLKRGAVNKKFYQQQTPMAPAGYVPYSPSGNTKIGRNKSGRPGRPVGSKDPRYAAYGGVYGWRKAQAQQRALQRIQAMQQATVSPEQQAYLNQIRARQQANALDPERRIIPTTYGSIPTMNSIQNEIDDATRIFD